MSLADALLGLNVVLLVVLAYRIGSGAFDITPDDWWRWRH